mgnify:CR=1 FL=1
MSKGVTIKSLLAAILLLAAISCSNDNSEKAQAVLNTAQSLYNNRQYDSTMSVLDSLYKKYPAETNIVRQGMYLMALAQEQSTMIRLAQADSVIKANMPIVEEIGKDFTVIKNPDLVENYRVYKTIAKNALINRTGIEPRVDDNGLLYIVSLLNGRAVKHTKLRVTSSDGASAETASVPYDKSQNYRFTVEGISNEMVTFHADQCSDFCQFIVDNASKQLKLEFVGSSTYAITLNKTLKEAIAKSYNYSNAIQEGLKAERTKLYLNKRLEIARKQIEQTKQKL